MPPLFVFALTLPAAVGWAAAASEPPPNAPTPARPEFCRTLETVIAAAAEQRPFSSLYGGLASNPSRANVELPGFEWRHLGLGETPNRDRRTYWCSRGLAPSELTSERLAADTARCLGVAPVKGEDRAWTLDAGPVVIRIDESCTDACDVGRRDSHGVEAKT